jgi:hypothetical protein
MSKIGPTYAIGCLVVISMVMLVVILRTVAQFAIELKLAFLPC